MTKQTKIVEFMPRRDMIRLLLELDDLQDDSFKEHTAIISINDTTHEFAYMMDHLDGYKACVLQFADTLDDTTITTEQAKEILAFINENRDRDFLVHCWAGISRSAAVAKFINEYLELDIPFLKGYHNHNHRVLNTLHAAAGTDLAAHYAELEEADRKFNPK